METLHDIRPPVMVGIPSFWIQVFWTGIFILFLILVLWFFIKRWKKRKSLSGGKMTSSEPISAHAFAMQFLDELEAEMAHSPDRKKMYFALGQAMKTYIGNIHSLRAEQMTTRELTLAMGSIDMDKALAEAVVHFQEESDLFRYAPVQYVSGFMDLSGNHDILSVAAKEIGRTRELIDAMEKDWQEKTANAKADASAASMADGREKTP